MILSSRFWRGEGCLKLLGETLVLLTKRREEHTISLKNLFLSVEAFSTIDKEEIMTYYFPQAFGFYLLTEERECDIIRATSRGMKIIRYCSCHSGKEGDG